MEITQSKAGFGLEVAKEFGQSVQDYHSKAVIQKKVAEGLIVSLRPWKGIIPAGPILEVGCGTGFLSEQIVQEFPSRDIHITDASKEMVAFTEQSIGKAGNLDYSVLDVNEITDTTERYALVVSNFSAQWFSDTAIGLEKLSSMLLPGGLLLVAFPGNQSFMEWYECCLELGLPYTANPLPDIEEVIVKLSLGPLQIDYYENDLFQDFDSSLDFLKHIKEIGAGKSVTGKSLSIKQLKLLTEFWDKKVNNKVKAKWHIAYLAAKKDMV
ncbi:MAG: methyltransferase domain-containing protein [Balneolaceae bacterium]